MRRRAHGMRSYEMSPVSISVRHLMPLTSCPYENTGQVFLVALFDLKLRDARQSFLWLCCNITFHILIEKGHAVKIDRITERFVLVETCPGQMSSLHELDVVGW